MLTFVFIVRSFEAVEGLGAAADETIAGVHARLDADVLFHGRSFTAVGGLGAAADDAVAGFDAGLDADVLLHGVLLKTTVDG
jgi:hypothetical protein